MRKREGRGSEGGFRGTGREGGRGVERETIDIAWWVGIYIMVIFGHGTICLNIASPSCIFPRVPYEIFVESVSR